MNAIRNACLSYFKGFHDVCINKNNCETKVLGILKIISYFTGIIPAAFAIVFQISRLCGRVKKNPKGPIIEKVENAGKKINHVAHDSLKESDKEEPLIPEDQTKNNLTRANDRILKSYCFDHQTENKFKPGSSDWILQEYFIHNKKNLTIENNLKNLKIPDFKTKTTNCKTIFPHLIYVTLMKNENDEGILYPVFLPKHPEETTYAELISFISRAFNLSEKFVLGSLDLPEPNPVPSYSNGHVMIEQLKKNFKVLNVKFDLQHSCKLNVGLVDSFPLAFLEYFFNTELLNINNSNYPNIKAFEKSMLEISRHFYFGSNYQEMKAALVKVKELEEIIEALEAKIESRQKKYRHKDLIMMFNYLWKTSLNSLKQIFELFPIPAYEKVLNENKSECCKPKENKETILIELVDSAENVLISAIFDKESFCKQVHFFNVHQNFDFAKNNEFQIDEIEPHIFKYILSFLNQEELVWPEMKEEDLIDLYDAARFLHISRLKALAVKEIGSRYSNGKWVKTDLLELYKGDVDLLGALLAEL